MSIDVVVVYSPVGGGHKAAATAVAERARARGLSVEIIDAFAHAPKWAGDAYLTAHLTGQNATPDLYGEMYFASNRRNDLFEPIRLGIDNLVFGALADRVRARRRRDASPSARRARSRAAKATARLAGARRRHGLHRPRVLGRAWGRRMGRSVRRRRA
jgi:hypothetical protein